MLNRAPNVYTPVEPEDNGVALPVVLSLVVHGAILAFIVLSHHIPKIKTPPAIETSIVTPEQLAQMQADISANREAMTSTAASQYTPPPSYESYEARNSAPTPSNEPRYIGSESGFSSGFSSIFGGDTEEPDLNTFEEDLEQDPITDNPFESDEGDPDTSTEPSDNANPPDSKPKGTQVDTTFPPGEKKTNNNPAGGKPNSASANKTNNKSKQQVAAELDALITPLWNAGEAHIGEKVEATIFFNKQGVVTKVETVPDDELGALLKQAIKKVTDKNAGQLPPVVGTGRDNIPITFTVSKK
ncbi:hypothetical protein [Psychrobacter sp. FDAARGOS_221]|uniref:hypothetical protein n=1 Tax=Psychrobacter sp. FDAARGOS_221 TaxID=1975705 RepID=UPI000BB54EDE|nr:hypothetical protein [Psychrobacter sp. FDAARGOS_221]PNK59886.1 hypothetical protein A6J60_002665 [Psychrobacter sp. FDAARGOS_221]